MSLDRFQLSIIIPTKNRVHILAELFDSIGRLDEIDSLRPEIIVADNGSQDNTFAYVDSLARDFPNSIKTLKVLRPGKSAAINEAVKIANGGVLAFLDDDVVVDKTWLVAIQRFFQAGDCRVGQGLIRLQSPTANDPEILRLVERYRTIPKLEHDPIVNKTISTLNGANFFLRREAFDAVGGLDERLGPGASGTSEDVDFARRLSRAGIAIGYAPQAVVYHHVDRNRLTDEYFKQSHWRQGRSRLLLRNRSATSIFFNLVRARAQYVCYTLVGNERNRYRSKGRIYHYLGMMEAKRNGSSGRQAR
jgi:glucosyl-dolichyl phosphate glucuronosyltransferase